MLFTFRSAVFYQVISQCFMLQAFLFQFYRRLIAPDVNRATTPIMSTPISIFPSILIWYYTVCSSILHFILLCRVDKYFSKFFIVLILIIFGEDDWSVWSIIYCCVVYWWIASGRWPDSDRNSLWRGSCCGRWYYNRQGNRTSIHNMRLFLFIAILWLNFYLISAA